MSAPLFYGSELAAAHHAGFSDFGRKAAAEVVAILQKEGIHSGTVVDLGCGGGLSSRVFLDAGFGVLGVDCSPAMIELARSAAPKAQFLVSDIYDAPIPSCVAVVAIGEVLAYIIKKDPREALPGFFRRVHGALADGGMLIFDVMLRSETSPLNYRARREGPGWNVEAQVTEEPSESLLTRRIETRWSTEGQNRSSVETHRVRTFSEQDMQALLKSVGFEAQTLKSYGATPLAPQRAAFVGRKPGELNRRVD